MHVQQNSVKVFEDRWNSAVFELYMYQDNCVSIVASDAERRPAKRSSFISEPGARNVRNRAQFENFAIESYFSFQSVFRNFEEDRVSRAVPTLSNHNAILQVCFAVMFMRFLMFIT